MITLGDISTTLEKEERKEENRREQAQWTGGKPLSQITYMCGTLRPEPLFYKLHVWYSKP